MTEKLRKALTHALQVYCQARDEKWGSQRRSEEDIHSGICSFLTSRYPTRETAGWLSTPSVSLEKNEFMELYGDQLYYKLTSGARYLCVPAWDVPGEENVIALALQPRIAFLEHILNQEDHEHSTE